ncbi:MAG: hypothetical protein JXJ17_19945 [Anaerolineae bacterium]|nr:hypothetical protein [Anaerolineae bacterium]
MPKLMNLIRNHKWLVIILIVFLIAGLVYDTATPIFEGLDEAWHYALIQHLASGGPLPVQVPGEVAAWQQEGNQPPLYYLLMAGATFWIDTGDFWAHRTLDSPDFFPGDPNWEGDKWYWVHTRIEDFPYRRTTLAVHLIRWLSLLMGAGTITLAYAAARELFPEREFVPVLTAAIVAFNPEFLFVSAQVNNDNLASLLGAAIGLMLARLWMRGYSTRLGIITAVLCGLTALNKLNGLVTLGVVAVVALLWAIREKAWKQFIILGVMCVATTFLIAGWWFVRNIILYNDIFAVNVLEEYVGRRSITYWQALGEIVPMHYSFWGLFGIANIMMPYFFYALYGLFTLIAIAGLILSAVKNRSMKWPPLIVPLVHSVLVLAGNFYYSTRSNGPAGRLAFTAIGALSLLAAVGLLTFLSEKRHRQIAVYGIAGGMAAMAVAAPFTDIFPTYRDAKLRPPLASEGIEAETYYDANVGVVAALRGCDLAVEGNVLDLTLHWEVLSPTDADLVVLVHVIDASGDRKGGADGPLIGGAYSSLTWSKGEWIADEHIIMLPDDMPPGEYHIGTGMYRRDNSELLPVTDAAGNPLETSPLIILPVTFDYSPD